MNKILGNRPWTREEDDTFSSLVSETNGTDWGYIGTRLNRPPTQCFSRCYAALNPVIVPCDFSKEDDERLTDLVVKEHGESAWQSVAMEMGTGHTESQLSSRWNKTLKQGIQSGRWNPVLDARLKAATMIYGEGKWSLISQHVLGKTDRKCRERYMEKLVPGLKPSGEWDSDEDNNLLAAVREFGIGSWSKIKDSLSGRTDQMCRYRYRKLMGTTPTISEEDDGAKVYEDKLNRIRELKLIRTRSSPSSKTAVVAAAIADSTTPKKRGRPQKNSLKV
jgi:hypothetical protein